MALQIHHNEIIHEKVSTKILATEMQDVLELEHSRNKHLFPWHRIVEGG